MKKNIANMINSKVSSIFKYEDYWQMKTDSLTFIIYNPVNLIMDCNRSINLNEENKDSIMGGIITNVIYNEKVSLIIKTDRNVNLFISLLDEDYLAPEAAQLNFTSGEIIIL